MHSVAAGCASCGSARASCGTQAGFICDSGASPRSTAPWPSPSSGGVRVPGPVGPARCSQVIRAVRRVAHESVAICAVEHERVGGKGPATCRILQGPLSRSRGGPAAMGAPNWVTGWTEPGHQSRAAALGHGVTTDPTPWQRRSTHRPGSQAADDPDGSYRPGPEQLTSHLLVPCIPRHGAGVRKETHLLRQVGGLLRYRPSSSGGQSGRPCDLAQVLAHPWAGLKMPGLQKVRVRSRTPCQPRSCARCGCAPQAQGGPVSGQDGRAQRKWCEWRFGAGSGGRCPASRWDIGDGRGAEARSEERRGVRRPTNCWLWSAWCKAGRRGRGCVGMRRARPR